MKYCLCAESEPRCSTNVSSLYGSVKEFDYVAFRCAVNYSGHWTPSMQWSTRRRALDGATYVINSNISQGVQQVSSAITLQVGANFNAVLFTCKTWFSEASMKIHYTNATNVPNYLFHWNTTVNVHCKRMRISLLIYTFFTAIGIHISICHFSILDTAIVYFITIVTRCAFKCSRQILIFLQLNFESKSLRLNHTGYEIKRYMIHNILYI